MCKDVDIDLDKQDVAGLDLPDWIWIREDVTDWTFLAGLDESVTVLIMFAGFALVTPLNASEPTGRQALLIC